MVDEQLLTIEQLAEYLQVSTKTIYRMIHKKQIPCYKVANQWRFKRDVIETWLEKDNFQPLKQSSG